MTDTALKLQETIAQQLMKVLYENITTLRVPWSITPEQAQKDILERMRQGVDLAVRKVVMEVLSSSAPHMIGTLHTITAKENVRATILLPKEKEVMHQCIDRVGSQIMLVMVDMEQYTGGMEKFRAQADQMPLIGEEG